MLVLTMDKSGNGKRTVEEEVEEGVGFYLLR